MFDFDIAFLVIDFSTALAITAIVARQFREWWLGLAAGTLAGLIVLGLLLPIWVIVTSELDDMFIGLEAIPD